MADAGLVVVTGATGFLGRSSVEHARTEGYALRPTGRATGIQPGVQNLTHLDVTDLDSAMAAMAGARSIIHLAGLAHDFSRRYAAADYDVVNAGGTANVSRAAVALGVSHLVVASTVAVYGQHPNEICREDTACRGTGPYAESKRRAEQLAASIVAGTRTRLTILRLGTIYGEEDPGNVARLIRAIDRGRFIQIGAGRNRKCLLHRDDAARACLLALGVPGGGTRVYNVAGTPVPMVEITSAITAALGRQKVWARVPTTPVRFAARVLWSIGRGRLAGIAPAVERWLSDDQVDSSAFCRDSGWRPMVGLAEGVRRQVAWHRRASDEAA